MWSGDRRDARHSKVPHGFQGRKHRNRLLGYACDLGDMPRIGIGMSELLTKSPFDPVREPRLVLFADSLPPDFGAVGQYALMRAKVLAERGHHVDLFGLSSVAASVEGRKHGPGSLTLTPILAP